MNKNITATAARQDFFKLLEKAGKPGMSVTITREGHPPVVVMSAEEYEGWQETLEILSDSTLVRAIRIGSAERGSVPLESVTASRPHAVRRSPQAKRRKAATKAA